MIHHPKTKSTAQNPHPPRCWNVHNPHVGASHNYHLVDELAKSPISMSILEVLEIFPSQRMD
jgi:hypothetical protein